MMACPFCKAEVIESVLVAGQKAGHRPPRPDDFSFCADCGEWATQDAAGGLRKPTHDEYVLLAGNANARHLRECWLLAQQDDPDTLGDKWAEFLTTMPKLPPRGAILCEASFYAGAFAFYLIQRNAAKANGGNAAAITDLLRAELSEFAENKSKEERG
jgi:hypothetical protein